MFWKVRPVLAIPAPTGLAMADTPATRPVATVPPMAVTSVPATMPGMQANIPLAIMAANKGGGGEVPMTKEIYWVNTPGSLPK